MTKCRDGYHGPYKDSVVILGRSGNQSQIVEAKGSFKPSDSELIEWATGIIELLVVINILCLDRFRHSAYLCVIRKVCLGAQRQGQSKTISAFY